MSPAPAKISPFPGLRPFTQQEDYLFFGREEQTLELLQRLGSNRFVAVVGTSGSGKSSLVRCGLLSELLGGRMLAAGASWEIAVTHPGGNPLALLTDALLGADLYDREKEHARENLLATLSRSHFGLVEAVKQADLGAGTNFLLVVDQFEEIFRFHEAGQTQQEAANEFVSLLLEAAAQKEVPIYVVLTMRSDFIGECGQFEGLAERVNRGEFLIPRLTREQYKRVIEGPIKVAGGQIAPRLLQRLLNDLGQQADQLPCLQHALMRTWDVWAGNGDSEALDLDDYQRVGKMSQALSLHADEIYQSLDSDRRRALCRGMFQALTVEEANHRGIRRPQRLGRLCQILEVPADELRPIIDAFRQSGVTFLMPSPEVELTDPTIIDISHESLMRVWVRLRQWVEEETQAAGIYHRLSESADLHKRGQAGLYRDPELGIALAWREAKRPNAAWAERYRPGFAVAMGFLEASREAGVAEEQAREAARQHELEQAQQLAEAQQLRLEQQQRSARKLRTMIAGLTIVAAIAVIACVTALVARNEAGKLARIADAEAEKARNNAQRAEQAQHETEEALTKVASSLTKAEKAEQVARAAEEGDRKLLYTTDMRLVPFVWRDDRSTAEQLRVLLAKHVPDPQATLEKPDLRGFEYYYYQHLLESSAAVYSGHAGPVADGAFTSNGQLVTLDQNGQVRRWNLDSQDEDTASRRDLQQGGAAVRVLSPDGRFAALAEGNRARVIDLRTGKEQFQIESANALARRLIFSPDSSKLVIVDNKIRWCDTAGGQVIASVGQQYTRGSGLALSADGLTLAVVGHGLLGHHCSIFRLDAAAQTVTPQAWDVGPGGTLSAAALSPEGRLLAVGTKMSGIVTVYDAVTGRQIAQHGSAHASGISALTFSGDGDKLVTADVAGTIKIWEDARKLTSKRAASMTFKGHEAAITHLNFSTDDKQLVSTSADKTARVWHLDHAGAAIRVLEKPGSNCQMARFSPDGLWIAAADARSVRLWDAATGKLVRELSAGDKGRVFSVAFSPTDPRLLAVGYGGQADVSHVALWDIDAGTELARLPGATDLPDFTLDVNTGAVGALAFSPDGKYLVAGFGSPNHFTITSAPNPLKVWEVATRRLIRRLSGHTGYCVSLDFARDGTQLASGSRDGTAIIWSTASWKATRTLQAPDNDPLAVQARANVVEDVAFSPDGKSLAMASREGSVLLWDVAGGKPPETLKGHSNAVRAVVFSPDGRTLATGGGDQTVRLWNVETRRELMQLDSGKVELGGVRSLAFSPDGKHLLAGGAKGTAFWSTAPVVWNDPDRAAAALRLLPANADFPSRARMLSENLRLHEALAKLDSNDTQVQAAVAGIRANWHAAHGRWAEAAREHDRLQKLSPDGPQSWLRTPGLLRVATALFHEGRPALAAALLTGGAKRRAQDGLAPVAETVGLGFRHEQQPGAPRITELVPGSPAAGSKLRAGDVLLKVNDVDVTDATPPMITDLLKGAAGTKVRLTVRHPGSDQTEDVQLVREKYLFDLETGELWRPLLAAVEAGLAKDPRDAGLLELRAELAGQWSDSKAQSADYTAAIAALSEEAPEAVAVALKRLYGRRGNAYVRLERWHEALADFAHAITRETTDEELLNNQARALTAVMLRPKKQDAATLFAGPWVGLATAYWLGRDQQAIDQLVEGRPKPAGRIGDVFIQGPDKDWPRAVAIYSRGITAQTPDVELLSKRARAYEALKNWEAAAADWSRAASGNPEEAKLLADFGQRLAGGGQALLANAQFEKAQALYEQLLGAGPENELTATELAQLLLNKHENGQAARWTVLKPTEMKSKGGATLTRLHDDSILVGGVSPAQDTYTFVAPTDLPRIVSIRLEALAHESLAKGGPGRAPWGNFALSEISLKAEPLAGAGATTTVKVINPQADFEQKGYPVAASLDGNSGTAWSIVPQVGKNHFAVFEIESARQNGFPGGTKLTFTLDFQFNIKHSLGRFRLSVRGDPTTFEREAQRIAVMNEADPWSKLAGAYVLTGDAGRAADVLAKSTALNGPAAWLESGVLTDEVLDALQAGHPDFYAALLPRSASAAAERGQIDQARSLYGRLVKLQPEKGLWKERAEQLRPGVLAAWHFDTGPGQWGLINNCKLSVQEGVLTARTTGPDPHFSTPVSSPAGGKALVLRYRTDETFPMRVFWADASGNFDDSRSRHFPIPASAGAWREISLPFWCKETLGQLRLGPDTADKHPLEIDSIVLRDLEPAEFLSAAAGAADRIAIIDHVYDQQQFAFATRLWAEALASDLKLRDDRQTQPRYKAARAAALAASGQGKDEPPLDDAAKAKLRGQALAWLKAELTAWTEFLDSDPPLAGPAIVQALSHWQKDTDLAGLRDAAGLANLPADEQKPFAQLWADAAALLKKAQEKPK